MTIINYIVYFCPVAAVLLAFIRVNQLAYFRIKCLSIILWVEVDDYAKYEVLLQLIRGHQLG